MKEDTKKDLIIDWVIGIMLVLTIICLLLYLADSKKELKKEDYQYFKAVKIPETINQYDSVYVDPTTVGTTTDPK